MGQRGRSKQPLIRNPGQPTVLLNRLSREHSLYLQQHANNPVDWYPWGDEALQKARSEKKMILLSIGYSSCHWCHVMERESFENTDIASIMNHHYVAIKVDREERPDIDSIYMEAVQLMTGHGGWPLNVWLTPELIPIYGGTYFPPETNHQRPGFSDVLLRMAEIFVQDPDKIQKRATEMNNALAQDVMDHISPTEYSLTTLRDAVKTTERFYDENYGGFSNAPKFPASMHVEFLLRYDKLVGDEEARSMALNTLRKMCLGGIHDQIGGGFHRYSTDFKWLVPHFEKMLYDNALLLSALCEAYQVSGDILLERTLNQLYIFLKRDLMAESGGFYASIDADSDGVEGSFYVWTYDELQKIIPESEFPEFSAFFDVYPGGNWEGSVILNCTHSSLDFSILTQTNHDDLKVKIDKWRALLHAHRSSRSAPVTDTKIITSWNAMTLSALCKYWFITLDNDLLAVIKKQASYLKLNAVRKDTVVRLPNQSEDTDHGFCEDFALLSLAFCSVFQVTGDESWLQEAQHIADLMIQRFYLPEQHAFSLSQAGQADLLVRKKDLFDTVTPSANSSAIAALYLVGKLTGITTYSTLCEQSIHAVGSILSDHALSFSYLLQLISDKLSHNGSEIVILGSDNTSFLQALATRYSPFSTVISGTDFEYSAYLTLKGKVPPNTGSHVYVCKNFSCQQPIRSLVEFEQIL
jgi:uncharacterized protein YyaL (SSP411 family)